MSKQKISKRNVGLAVVLATLVFVMGIFFGQYTSERKYNDFSSTVADLRIQTLSIGLQTDLLATDPCSLSNSTFLVSELSTLNSKLDYLERLYGQQDPEILRLKQYYSILQIQHWLLYRESQNKCDDSYDLILYFYSNEGCDDCEQQGTALTAFRKKYPDNVKVYAFDKDLLDPALQTLVDLYDVQTTPSIVFNGNPVEGYVSFIELESLRFNQTTQVDLNTSD